MSNPVVLVADDDVDILDLVVRHMRARGGFDIVEASSGDEALKLAHQKHPALVILDVMMPGMTGWEVCRALRAELPKDKSPAVIMLTGIGERLNEMTSPLYGADAFLDKPFESRDLDARITEALAKREARLGG